MPDITTEITCRGCALLCDDLLIDDDQTGRLKCQKAVDWLKQAKSRLANSSALPADHHERLSRATELLKSAQSPLIAGLTGLSLAAETAAVQLAESMRGYLSLGSNRAGLTAAQRYGGAGCTWGEVRHRADVILCGQFDPFTALSRFGERMVDPPGRIRKAGESARLIYLGTEAESLPEGRYEEVISVSADQLEAALIELRRQLSGTIPRTGSAVSGLDAAVREQLQQLAETLNGAAYPVLLTSGGDGCSLQWTKMVRETNDRSRLHRVSVPSGPAVGNASETLLAWCGFPDAVRFSETGVAHDLDRFQPETLIEQGSVDLLVFAAGVLTSRWEAILKSLPANLPVVAIVEQGVQFPETAAAVTLLEAGVVGQQVGGVMLRSDGVPLPLRPFAPAELPSLAELLEQLNPAGV